MNVDYPNLVNVNVHTSESCRLIESFNLHGIRLHKDRWSTGENGREAPNNC